MLTIYLIACSHEEVMCLYSCDRTYTFLPNPYSSLPAYLPSSMINNHLTIVTDRCRFCMRRSITIEMIGTR